VMARTAGIWQASRFLSQINFSSHLLRSPDFSLASFSMKALIISACLLVYGIDAVAGSGGKSFSSKASSKSPTTTRSSSTRATSSRPTYSGSTHTSSHGGTYVGGTDSSSHAGGKYVNPSSGNRYGIHSGTAKGATR
jgi:hypothetical protein